MRIARKEGYPLPAEETEIQTSESVEFFCPQGAKELT
jgi:hypothetical protein